MPFNPKTDANITVSKQHKEMLKRIAVEQKRTLRATAEMLIEDCNKSDESLKFTSRYMTDAELRLKKEYR